MPKKSLRPCRQPGCPELVQSGYCSVHNDYNPRKHWDKLDQQKDPRLVAFYGSYKWKRTSKLFRIANPLCERCYSRGIIRVSQLSHHDPELTTLLDQGLNPFDWMYLHAICDSCHLEDLRNKRTPRTTPNTPRT